MIDLLILTLATSLGIQAVFFAIAVALRTDKVTDLSYGLTFVILALLLVQGRIHWASPATVLALMIVIWGVRLGTYLLVRILRMGRDRRFDGVRERVWKFAQFWFLQGLAAWLIMLPTTLWFTRPAANDGWSISQAAGAGIWLAGLVLETVADAQKFRARNRQGDGARWIDQGLWRYSRHPNYFGELLCWWALFAFVAPGLGWWAIAGVAGPLTITGLLIFVTGIPPLAASAERRWGADPDYVAYRRRTSRVILWPRVRSGADRA